MSALSTSTATCSWRAGPTTSSSRAARTSRPAEIEDTLLRHGSVQAAVVVGVPHPEWGESVAAAVVLAEAAGPDHAVVVEELTLWVRSSLGSLKTPSVIEVREELPTTATGKVLRRVVRDELAPPTPS